MSKPHGSTWTNQDLSAVARERKKRAPNKCPTCKIRPALPSHACPYAEDVGNDPKSNCRCCATCQNNCARDI